MTKYIIPLVFALTAVPAWGASARLKLSGHLLPPALTRQRVASLPDTRVLDLLLGLSPPDAAAIEQRVRDTYDPSSPRYRHFLTPDQFGDEFGAPPALYQRVLDFAARHGLTIRRKYRSRLQVGVEGTVSEVSRAFGIKFSVYRRPDGSTFYAPDSEPVLDEDVPVAHISGLDDYSRLERPRRKAVSEGPVLASRPPARGGHSGEGTGVDGTYVGSDLRAIYMPCTSLSGAGQTVGLVEFDNYNDSDIASYASVVGQAPSSVTRRLVDESSAETPGSEIGEVSLDIEMVMAMAPGAAIVVYELPNEDFSARTDLLSAIADDDTAQEVSSSWYWYGWTDTNVAAIFQQYAVQGQTYLNLSGDQGAFGGGGPIDQPYEPVIDSPLMTVVGGTTLSTTGNGSVVGSYVGETTWNQSPGPAATAEPAANAVGGGGACANGATVLLAIPTYQVPFVNAGNGASSSARNIPDVALTASSMFAVYDNEEWNMYGTSASAPLWAGVVALVNQEAAQLGQSPVGYINPMLYHLAASPASYAADFHDINDGSNNSYWGNNPSHYTAVDGYDLCTGLGSPRCDLIDGLLGVTATFTPSSTDTPGPIESVTSTPPSSVSSTFSPMVSPSASATESASPTMTQSFTQTPSGTQSLSFTGSPSFSASPTSSASASASSTGTITPTATPSGTRTCSPTRTPTWSPSPVIPGRQYRVIVYPNPSSGAVWIAFPPDGRNVQVEVYSLAGGRVASFGATGQQAQAGLIPWDGGGGRLAGGIYIVVLDEDGNRYFTKLALMESGLGQGGWSLPAYLSSPPPR